MAGNVESANIDCRMGDASSWGVLLTTEPTQTLCMRGRGAMRGQGVETQKKTGRISEHSSTITELMFYMSVSRFWCSC